MANRLVLTFLFVMLAGSFMGTYAQSSTASTTATTAASTTATTAASTSATTAASTTATTAASTTATTAASTTATTAASTSATTAASTSATTAASTSATTAASTTATTAASTSATTAASTSATTAASTSATTAASTSATTAASTTVAATTATVGTASTTAATTASAAPATTSAAPAATTTAAPFNPNSTVTNLTAPISASNCSKTQLCARQPSGCDPSTGTGCFFLGVQQLSGQNFEFSLSGNSDGYIAVILSRNTTSGINDTTYICAKNNSAVQYFSALLNNGTLTTTTLPVNNVRGTVNGSKIQCVFDVTVPDSSQRAAAAFSEAVATGSFNASTGALGSPTPQLRTPVVDLTNVNATTTNLLANTTTPGPTVATTNNAVTIQQSLMQALLITVGVLSLTML